MKRALILLFMVLSIINFIGCSDDDVLSTDPNGDPLSESVVYNGVIYTGLGDVLDSSNPRINSTASTGIQISRPTAKGFKADGCFVLAGLNSYVDDAQYTLIEVTNLSSISPASYYWVRGNFQRRIWLRSGLGEYKVSLFKVILTIDNLNYEGAISGWSYSYYTDATYDMLGVYNFFVTNTRDESGVYYYPSGPIQSDNSQIKSIADSLVRDITNQTLQVKAIHDYVVRKLEYDYDSVEVGQRKKQDALSSLNNEMAVCEGYALLFSALARSVGIRSKYISGYVNGDPSAGHAWSAIEVDGSWSLVDTTWDDPGPHSDDYNNIRWTYFMQDEAFFVTNDHTWESDNIDRGVIRKEVIYELKGYPRGSY